MAKQSIFHHLVSKAYQQNFADTNKKLAVFDVTKKRFEHGLIHIRKNFVQEHFCSYTGENDAVTTIEAKWAAVESQCLPVIRCGATGPTDCFRKSVVELVAMHIVRSHGFEGIFQTAAEFEMAELVKHSEENPEVIEAFCFDFGRAPAAGEITFCTRLLASDFLATRKLRTDLMWENFERLRTLFRNHSIQIIEVASDIPGLILPDTPIVHYDSRSGRTGFVSGLPIDEADLVLVPLTRHRAACLSSEPVAPLTITTISDLRCLNALLIKAALHKFACHPDDRSESDATWRSRNERLIDPWIRLR
jgi:hypothetical protein